MTIDEVLRARRSVRRFKPEAPPRELIERLLDAAVTAPSASNKQPWRFLVITRRELIAQMASRVRAAVDRVAQSVAPDSEASFRAYGEYFTRFEHAPVVIVPICRASTVLSNLLTDAVDPGDRARVAAMEDLSGVVSTALAIENLLLTAPALGLGASGMTGPLLAADQLAELLRVPASWHLVAVIPVGFPDETPAPTERKPASQVTRWYE